MCDPSYMHALPPLFAFSTDPRSDGMLYTFCCLSDDARQLVIVACTLNNNTVWRNTFDGRELTTIKAAADASLPWDQFFQHVAKNFNCKDIVFKFQSGQLVCQVKVGSGVAPFQLKATEGEERGDALFLERMYEFYHQRAGKNFAAQRLEELKATEKTVKQGLQAVNAEKTHLVEGIAAAEAEEKSMLVQQAELELELQEVMKEASRSYGDDSLPAPLEPDVSSCLGRVPLPTDHKKLDLQLMKLIKSKWAPQEHSANSQSSMTVTSLSASFEQHTDENEREPALFNKICRPWSVNEFDAQMKSISATEKWHVMQCLKKIDDWDFDVLAVQDLTGGSALFILGYTLLIRYDLLRKFSLNEEIVVNFLSQIEAGYHPNPYHNSMHAADVTHVLHYILSPGGMINKAALSSEDTLAALLAAMIHDYDHPGINNNFHIKVHSYLATLYNDRSILENHHCAEVFELMKNPKFDILGELKAAQRKEVRDTIIEMVLSTDMGLHAKILQTWKKRILQNLNLSQSKEDQRLALSMAIKMADISNCGRPKELYLKWSTKIAEEFYMQGDRERNLGFESVSPFMDRFTPSMSRGQIAFMNYIVVPLFETICEFCPDMHFCTEHTEANKQYWMQNSDDL